MPKFLADENVPRVAVEAARAAGFDVTWIGEGDAGTDDIPILERAVAESRVLITSDKDFGDLVFAAGRDGSCGVILLRPKSVVPDDLARLVTTVLTSDLQWEDHFAVADETRIRMRRLPESESP